MRQSTFFAPTLREAPADAEAKSHILLVKAGFIRQLAAGIYTFLPLGLRILQKVEAIVREEMNRIGAQELLMPTIQPAELWRETGRWELYGPELMRLKDRHERDFALGPTHEEVITRLLGEVHTYKKLPVTLYQIQTKYRDEKRPRFGLLRGREFIMKDAYSFDADWDGLDRMYEKMYEAYCRVFSRCGLDFRAVVADSGAIGGKDTLEFMALADIGEDTIAYSDASEYAANIEMAEVSAHAAVPEEDPAPLHEVAHIEKVPLSKQIAMQLFYADDQPVAVLVRGDHEVNDVKLKHALGATVVEQAPSEKTRLFSRNGEAAPLGPFDLAQDVTVIADQALKAMVKGVCPGPGVYYENVNPKRDLPIRQYDDIRMIQEGDPSPDGKGNIKFARGIEVGQIFKLGTRYSEPLGAEFLDENGKKQTMIMGCYGIGISRTIAAIVEQHHDEHGIIWPRTVAPFDVHLLCLNPKDEIQHKTSEQLYHRLQNEFAVLYDDRSERAGVKFADSDLIGIPLKVIVGKKAAEKIVEVKRRDNGKSLEVPLESLHEVLREQL